MGDSSAPPLAAPPHDIDGELFEADDAVLPVSAGSGCLSSQHLVAASPADIFSQGPPSDDSWEVVESDRAASPPLLPLLPARPSDASSPQLRTHGAEDPADDPPPCRASSAPVSRCVSLSPRVSRSPSLCLGSSAAAPASACRCSGASPSLSLRTSVHSFFLGESGCPSDAESHFTNELMAAGEPEARASHAPLPEEDGEEEEEIRSQGAGSSSMASGQLQRAREPAEAEDVEKALALQPESCASRPSSPFSLLLLPGDAGAGVWDRLLAWVAQLQSGLRLALARDEARRSSPWDLDKMACSPWPRADAFLGQLGPRVEGDGFQGPSASDPGSLAGELEAAYGDPRRWDASRDGEAREAWDDSQRALGPARDESQGPAWLASLAGWLRAVVGVCAQDWVRLGLATSTAVLSVALWRSRQALAKSEARCASRDWELAELVRRIMALQRALTSQRAAPLLHHALCPVPIWPAVMHVV